MQFLIGLAITSFLGLLLLIWVALVDIGSYLKDLSETQRESTAALTIICNVVRRAAAEFYDSRIKQ